MGRSYRGWKSTKLHLALITMTLITVVYGLTGFPPAAFDQFCMALIAGAGIYSSAAAVEKFSDRQRLTAAPVAPGQVTTDYHSPTPLD